MARGPESHQAGSDWETVRETPAYVHELRLEADRRGADDRRSTRRTESDRNTELVLGGGRSLEEVKSGADRLLGWAVGGLVGGAYLLRLIFDWPFWVFWVAIGLGLVLSASRTLIRAIARKRRREPVETLFQEHGMRVERQERAKPRGRADAGESKDPVSKLGGSSLPRKI